jgi:hypothetical protein
MSLIFDFLQILEKNTLIYVTNQWPKIEGSVIFRYREIFFQVDPIFDKIIPRNFHIVVQLLHGAIEIRKNTLFGNHLLFHIFETSESDVKI